MSKLIKKNRPFTAVYNDIINDPRISLKAKGLYLFLYSKPDNWTFSARLVATQNKDSILSVNTGLQELENFGLLVRTHVQGGYYYEIFDKIKIHSIENRLNGKSTKQKSKIHSMENQSNISNKEFKAKEEEERENYLPPLPEIVEPDLDCFPFAKEFILHCSKNAKNFIAYSSSLSEAMYNSKHKNHSKTVLAYSTFVDFRPDLNSHGVLPAGVNIFDLIGRV